MKLFISSDIEGTTGITTWDETEKGEQSYTYFAKQMTNEVTAVCCGANEVNVEKIVVKDAHDSARNLNPEALPENVELIRGWAGDGLSMMSGINKDNFDAVAFTGYHSYASNDGNPLSHTMNTKNEYVKINGVLASEFLINSYIAGYYGVPVVFLTGDKALCDFAKSFIPNITTVAVNEGCGASVKSIHPKLATKLMQEGIKKALTSNLDCTVPMPKHFEVEISFKNHQIAYSRSLYPTAKLEGTKVVKFESDDYFEVLRFFHFVL